MEPVLKEGSFLLGTRIYSTLDEGDIIVFRHDGRGRRLKASKSR